MTCASRNYSGGDSPNILWKNWSRRVVGPVANLFEPDSLPDLVNIVVRAEAEGHQLRVVGSGWAFEDAAYSPDWMVSMVRLKRRLRSVTDFALNSQWAANQGQSAKDSLFHMESGASIAEVNEALDAAGLALPTMGGANGQSLAGAISTGTHGGDIFLPPFPDLVMAMHLVTASGREVWVERASEAITDDLRLGAALTCQDAQLLRNDELFNALLVGLGRFGIIYSYVLRVTAAFRLAEWTVQIPPSVLTAQLRLGLAQQTLIQPLLDILPDPPAALGALDVKKPRGLEVSFDTQNLNLCWVKRRWLTETNDSLNNTLVEDELCKIGARGVLDQSKHALWGAGALAAASGIWLPLAGPIWAIFVATKINWLENQLRANPEMSGGNMLALVLRVTWDIGAGFIIPGQTAQAFAARYRDTTTEGKRGPSHEILSGFAEASLQDCYRGDSVEPIFDAHRDGYINFLDAILGLAPGLKQAGYISLRWSATSKATLSMHNVESPNAVAVEVTSLSGLPDNGPWMSLLESLAFACEGRPHWGQINTMSVAVVAQMYGPKLRTWRESLASLTGSSAMFSSAYTVHRGLEPPDRLPFSAEVLSDGPIAYYRLDESTGATTAADSSWHGNHGILSPRGIKFEVPGLIGDDDAAMLFDGTGVGRITVRDQAILNPKTITMEALIMWGGPNPEPNQANQQRILEKSRESGDPGWPGYHLSILPGGAVRVELSIGRQGPPDLHTLTSTSLITPNVVTHVAGTYDGSRVAIYINGVLDATADASGDIFSSFQSSDLGIGNQVERDRPFNGIIDEVAVFDKALSEDRIGAHVAASAVTR